MADVENPPVPSDAHEKSRFCSKKNKSKGGDPPADAVEKTNFCSAEGDPATPWKKPILIEFRDFVLGGNLIRIAVAFVLALSIERLINAFVGAFITPILGIIGAREFKDLTFSINDSVFTYGNFLDALIAFFVICLVLFFCLILPVQRYGGKCVPAWIIRKCPYCFSDMPAIGSKCPSCCSAVEPMPVNGKAA